MSGSTIILRSLVFSLILQAGGVEAQLRTALEVRSLSVEGAESEMKVDLSGVVIFSDGPGTVFFQDGTAGTFFQLESRVAPEPGDEVRVRGTTFPGLYLPGITDASFEILGHPGLPEAVKVGIDDLGSGRYHYQRVAIEGIVRTVEADGEGTGLARVALGSRLIEVRIESPAKADEALIEARVRVTGLAAGEINQRRQLVAPYLRCRDWSDLVVLEPARGREVITEVSADQLLNFAVGGQELRRVRLKGEILAVFPEGDIFLRGGDSGIGIRRADSEPPLLIGDRVDLLGFPEMDRFSARLVDSVVVGRSAGTTPRPVAATMDDLLEGAEDGNLVTLVGEVGEQYRNERGGVMVLRDGNATIRVDLPESAPSPVSGAKVRVTGIARVESTKRSSPYRSEPVTVALRMRMADDLVVLGAPSWWTSGRLGVALVLLVVATVLAGLWITLLRRQVTRQTAALRHRIEHEAALEERQRIAREFHDTLEQDLAGLSLRLDAAAVRGTDEKLRGFIEGSRNLVSRIQIETRNLVSDLRQDPGGEADLIGALGELVERQSGDGGPEVVMVSPENGIAPLPSRTVHHLRMIAQESVTNVLKHAAAKRVVISVSEGPALLELRIADDGVGFETGGETLGGSGHFGCMGMRERCRKIGAEIEWRSKAGEGTEVVVRMPVKQEKTQR